MDEALFVWVQELWTLVNEDQALSSEIDALRAGDPDFERRLSERQQQLHPWPSITPVPALLSLGTEPGAPEALRRYVEVAAKSAAFLARLVEDGTWPSIRDVGESGVVALASLAAHMDDRPALRERLIAIMGCAVRRGELDPRLYAHVADRHRALEAGTQLYGTLLVPGADGAVLIVAVSDPDGLDKTRQSIGLAPLAVDIEHYRQGAVPGPFLIPSDP